VQLARSGMKGGRNGGMARPLLDVGLEHLHQAEFVERGRS
jgi:hypothetical protein